MTSAYVKLTRSLTDIAWGAPYVMATRTARLLAPGAAGSARERQEVSRMIAEKQAAAVESGLALTTAWQRGMLDAWTAVMFGRLPAAPSQATLAKTAQAALTPYRQRVKANAQRLRKRTRRV